jgi:hypothetical protein
MGEDVAEAGTTFKVLTGLVDEFGKDRIIDTPISEAGFTGLGVGAAMAGMRPIVDIMFGDFMTIIMDQVVNQAAKIHYMSGGTGRCRWSSARRWARRADRPRSTRSRCTRGPATSRAEGGGAVDARTTPKGCSRRPCATTTRSSSSSTRSATAR